MKKFYLVTMAASLLLGLTLSSCGGDSDSEKTVIPDPTPTPTPKPTPVGLEKYEMGKPGDDDYRYLDEFKGLKEYIDYSKYPNFKLGVGTTVNDYLTNTLVKDLTNKNFTETVAGNAMKMGSVVDGSGNMNFTTVKNYVTAATEAGLNVYGHTLAWHSQQPINWLTSLLADKPDPNSAQTMTVVASKDFTTDQTIGEFKQNITPQFDATNGLIIKNASKLTNYWDLQFEAMSKIPVQVGQTYTMTISMYGSTAGTMHAKMAGDLNDAYSTDYCKDFDFTSGWQDLQVEFKPASANCFLLLQCGDFVGDIYVKSIKFEGMSGNMIPLTAEERKEALIGAMDKWIKGMMEACEGKVKAWDMVNEAIAGEGNDGEGNYELQHSKGYKGGTWDVGGQNFFWQDHLGDIDYIRVVHRLARKYGPEDIKLFINDYNLESDWDDNKKLKSLINWIKKWEADGETKIDGIGTQMHINCFENATHLNNVKTHITQMFKLMAATGKLVRVSELDMGYVRGSDRWGDPIKTDQLTENEHKAMAEFYAWIINEYLTQVPPAQQWGICQWCPTDSPAGSGWRGGEPVGIWDLNYYRKHVYGGFVKGLSGN